MTLTQIKPAGLSKPVDLADNEKIRLGTGTDSEIFSDGTHTRISQLNGSGFLSLSADNFRVLKGDSSESMIRAFTDGAVELYYDNDRKLRTVSNGAFVETSSGDCYLTVRTESDNSSDDAVIRAYTQNNQASTYLMFGDIDDTFMGGLRYNNSNNTLFFYTNNAANWRIDSNGNLLNNDDSRKLQLGASEDLQLWHDGTHSHLQNTQNSGKLKIRSHETNIKNSDDNETQAVFHENGAVELYYDNSKKFETTGNGATVSGELTVNSHLVMGDGDKLRLGDSNDLELHHSSGENYIQGHLNQLYIRSAQGIYIQPNTNENGVVCNANSSTELYHNNNKKFATQNGGARVHGYLGVNRDPAGSHPLWVQGSNQYVIGLTNTSASATNFPWLLHKSINSTQAFGIHFNGLSGDPFHCDKDGGIFLGGETGTANRLDDYEEGSWTPTTHGTWNNLGTFRHTVYTKIGRLVTVHFDLFQTSNNMGWSAGAHIRGFPFSAKSNTLTSATLTTFSYTASDAKFIPNYFDTDTGANLYLHNHSQSNNIRHLWFNLTYMT